ncbi:MAG: hypothetical protein JWM54_1806 [Acidobacteriaceae bacterium]|nr:hypothetical protein [Acidobacteriaceae bacterium]
MLDGDGMCAAGNIACALVVRGEADCDDEVVGPERRWNPPSLPDRHTDNRRPQELVPARWIFNVNVLSIRFGHIQTGPLAELR